MLHAINNNLNNRKKREVFRMKRKEERREKCNQCFLLCSPSPPIIGFFVCAVYNLLRDSAPKRTEKKETQNLFLFLLLPFPVRRNTFFTFHSWKILFNNKFALSVRRRPFNLVEFCSCKLVGFCTIAISSYCRFVRTFFFFVLCLVHTLTWRAYNLLERWIHFNGKKVF